jgi:two-component system, sporulation sensor kinase A
MTENFHLIFNNVSDLICLIEVGKDEMYRWVDANPAYLRVTGLSEKQMGKTVQEILPEKEAAFVQQKYREAIDAGKPIRYEETVEIPDFLLIVEVTMIPIFNEEKECTHLLGVAHDITELRKKEEMLRKTDRLTIAGNLAAGIAHEVRNPLTVLRGFIQLWKNEKELNPAYFDVMTNEIHRIESIIDEFLMLSSPKKMDFQKKQPADLLQNLLPLFEAQAVVKNVTITTDFSPDVPPIECVENQMKQVFVNILKNALEAVAEGGTIQIEVKKTKNHFIAIRFTDDGYGIPGEKIKMLGEPYYTTKEKGTGLGLMVSYNIIESHKGKIQVQSEPGQGTVFEILLPISP